MIAGEEWETARAAVAAHRPLGPTYGNPQQQESAEVGDHEGAAAIGDRLTRKAEKNYPKPTAEPATARMTPRREFHPSAPCREEGFVVDISL